MTLQVANDGPRISSTNFWSTELAKREFVYVSVNAGAFRLLLPDSLELSLQDMAQASQVVVSRGPWWEQNLPDALELLFEDGSSAPYALHMHTLQWDRLPGGVEDGRSDLTMLVYTRGSTERLSLPAAFRMVAALPCLRPWSV